MKKIIPPMMVVATLFSWATCCCQAQRNGFITRDAGPYFWGELGPTFAQDGHITEFTGFGTGNKISYDVGFKMDAAVGYAFNRYLATEFEFGGSDNRISSVQGFALNDTFVYNAPFLANLVFQCPIPRTRVVPYIGAGLGGSATVLDTFGMYNGAVTLSGTDSDFVFAYQAFAGVRVDLNDHMFVGLGYKYLATEDSTYHFEPLVFGSGPTLNLGLSGMRTHTVTFSFTMKF